MIRTLIYPLRKQTKKKGKDSHCCVFHNLLKSKRDLRYECSITFKSLLMK